MIDTVSKVLLFISIAGLVYVLFNFDITPNRKIVLSCNPNEITSLSVLSSGRWLNLKRNPSKPWQWFFKTKQTTKLAYPPSIEGFKKQLCTLPFVDTFELGTQGDVGSYGFSNDGDRVILGVGARSVALMVGAMAPTGTEFYVMRSDMPKSMYVVPNLLQAELLPDAIEFYPRNPLNLNGVNRIAVSIGEHTLTLAKRKGANHWHIDPKFESDGTPLITDLKKLTFTRFIGPVSREDQLSYGFFSPDLKIKLFRSTDDHEVFELSYFASHYYLSAYLDGNAYILLLDPRTARSLLSAAKLWIFLHPGLF